MINQECLSYYLGLRYIPFSELEWLPGISPELPLDLSAEQEAVGSVDEIMAALQRIVGQAIHRYKIGIFLSGGIDSAILAAFLPRGAKAYTIDFDAASGAREKDRARHYAEAFGLDLGVVRVGWQDYQEYEAELMVQKKAPLHPVEVALRKAAIQARADGLDAVFVGNGADSTFGGMDKLLSRDWTYDEFVSRYTFVEPEIVLEGPVDIRPAYAPYRRGDMIDYIGFIKRVHGLGIIQAFNNSVEGTGIRLIEPFEKLKLKVALDLDRIRRGEPKYLLVNLFHRLYPHLPAPAKVPFARPMDEWLADYVGPKNEEFLQGLRLQKFTGDQKYLVRCLDLFVSLLKEDHLCPLVQ